MKGEIFSLVHKLYNLNYDYVLYIYVYIYINSNHEFIEIYLITFFNDINSMYD